MSFACAVRIEDGIDVGAIVIAALEDCRMAHKEAWLTCGIDAAGWSRAIRGQQPLDLWKLRHLPVRWWQAFLPSMASALIRSWWKDQTIEVRMATPAPPAVREEKRRA